MMMGIRKTRRTELFSLGIVKKMVSLKDASAELNGGIAQSHGIWVFLDILIFISSITQSISNLYSTD